LDQNGVAVTEVVTTNGALASAPTATSFLRIAEAFVSASGSYANALVGSHAGDIVVEDAAGTEDWATITATGFARGETQIGVYTIPLGYNGYITDFTFAADSNKAVDLLFFKREGVLDTVAPYHAMRLVEEYSGAVGFNTHAHVPPLLFPALTDIGFMASVAVGAADVSVTFNVMLQRAG
jgi:hypothetical protein